MFKKPPKGKQPVDHAIDATFGVYNPNEGDDALQHIEMLERLHKIKSAKDERLLDPNTILMVGGNIIGILVIVGYEQKNVITSKALQFLSKAK